MRTWLAGLGFAALSLASSVQRADACGLDWSVPRDHFDGVNEIGVVSYWDKIGELNIGENEKFPLVIGFQSDRERSSPYLGYGWVMPLLESYMVQKDENTFEIMKPGGYTSGFGRDSKNPSLIGGVKGWKGKIEGDTIKVWADCGWSLTYTKGKLTNIGTPKNKNVRINRDLAGLVNDVTTDGTLLLKVRRGAGGVVSELELADGRVIEFEQVEKPRMQAVQGRNLVAGRDLSLGGIVLPDGRRISFGYDPTPDLLPRIEMRHQDSETRSIVWNPANKFIISDNDWKYSITPPTAENGGAAIERIAGNGEKEFWHHDAGRGQEISLERDGSKVVTSWFTSGRLAGKLRSSERYLNGQMTYFERYAFDESAELIRITKPDGMISYKSGKPVEVIKNGKIIWSVNLDSNGRVLGIKHDPSALQNVLSTNNTNENGI